jgi:hypothetical protein
MDDARVADQRALNDQLLHLENNRQRLMDTLSESIKLVTGRSKNSTEIHKMQIRTVAVLWP